MAKGKLNIQAADGAVIGLVVPDGLVSGERQIALGANLSGITAYHLLQGNLAVSNSTITQGFNTTLYTLNGAVQAVNTGIDMDTQWGSTAEERFGGLVWQKTRTGAAAGHRLCDTVRGVGNMVFTDATNIQTSEPNSLSAFSSTGFSGGGTTVGASGALSASWNFQTTHRVSGTTNHGKAYTCHYNPFTGFTIVKYEGSGIAGHEIPHHLGRKLGFFTNKCLTNATYNWVSQYRDGNYLYLNTTEKELQSPNISTFNETNVSKGTTAEMNGSGQTYILYGWANSYFDESNKLIGNYEIGVYQGPGAAGNKVTTRGKPAWVMIKRLDSAAGWITIDNIRGDNELYPHLTNIEASFDRINIVTDGFTLSNGDANSNASGGQYLYMVVYDNDNGSGKSKYPKATDTTNLAINALVPYANGIDVNGSKVSISYKNETISGLTLTQGKNYPYSKNDGTYGSVKYMPMYGALRDRSVAGENPDYFDLETRKWYGTSGGNELVTNGDGISLTGWQGTSYNGSTNVADASVLTLSSGTFVLTNATGKVYAGMQQQLSGLTVGRKYKLLLDLDSNNLTNACIRESSIIGTSNFNGSIATKSYSIVGKQYLEFVATASILYLFIFLENSNAGIYTQLDNISVFEATPTIGAEITPRTYLDCIVYADHNGQVEYVEELPKIEYKDIVKANEYQGKNACTAWVNFDGTTTPPTIRDSYNVASVVRVGTGQYDIYFKTPMDNTNYSVTNVGRRVNNYTDGGDQSFNLATNKVSVDHFEGNVSVASSIIHVQVFGGKN